MITDYEGDMPNLDVQVDGEIPIFVTRNLVMFPGILSPILVGRKPTLALVEHLEENPNTIIAIVSQKDSNINDPQVDDVYMHASFVPLICLVITRVTTARSSCRDLVSVRLRKSQLLNPT